MAKIRIGLIGAGRNTRERHIPGLLAIPGVELAAVCNRRPESTAAVARDFKIPRTFDRWQDVIIEPEIDAIVIGTWPYLHCPITLAALGANKHVITEARMSCDLKEAKQMLAASKANPTRVVQIVPSPLGLHGDTVMRRMLGAGYLGELREYTVTSMTGALADPETPLSWRQDEALSGINMLTLGIVHETVSRWIPQPRAVVAQTHAFTPARRDPERGTVRPVGTPDSVQVLTQLANGARGVYQISGVTPVGQGAGLWLYGTRGMIHYDFVADRIYRSQRTGTVEEVPIPDDPTRGWHVEADFIASILSGVPVKLTDFPTGVAYMEFTDAVARSAASGSAATLSATT